MCRAASLHRNTMTRATSSGSATRPNTDSCSARSSTSRGSLVSRSVLTKPGATALTLTLEGPRSTAADLVSPISPALLGAHRLSHRLDAVEGAGQVHVQHLLPRFGLEPPQGAVVGHAGVVDEVMHPAQPLPHRGDELVHFSVAADVAAGAVDRHTQGPDRRFGEEGLGGDVPLGEVDVIDGYGRPAPRVTIATRPCTVSARRSGSGRASVAGAPTADAPRDASTHDA